MFSTLLTFLLQSIAFVSALSTHDAHPHPTTGGRIDRRDLINKINARASWTGWSNIKTIFSFGDSWTETGFDAQGAQPSLPDYPLGGTGNNIQPSNQFLRYTYVSYMAVKYNDSAIEEYNVAVAGATVNNADIEHGVDDFVTQVEKIYLPTYGAEAAPKSTGNSSQALGKPSRLSGSSTQVSRRGPHAFRKRSIPWDPASTLFTSYFGVNDVEVSATNETAAGSWDREFATYARLLDELYQTGARNFLILNLAAMDLAPNPPPDLNTLIPDWNTRLETMARNFTSAYDEVNLFFFDTNSLFQQVIKDPSSYPETKGLTNVTGYCAAYAKYGSTQVSSPTDTGEGCDGTFEQYLWRDNLHPGLAMNMLMASQIAKGLR